MKRSLIFITALVMTMMMSVPAFAAGTSGGTAADPVQANSSDTATLYLGKVLTVSQPDKFPTITDYSFNVDKVKAWDNANVSTAENGTVIQKEAMPSPIPKDTSSHSVTNTTTTRSVVTVGDFNGTANTSVADTTTEKYRNTPVEIKFTKAGYYVYKITENPAPAISGMQYDGNSYFAVVYVCNNTDSNGNTIPGVYVHDITSYRNESGSETYQPDLSDIQNTADNNGNAAAANNYTNLGKVGHTDNEHPNQLEAFRFYNDQTTHDVVITNNVTGNLGDITKEFEYTVTLSGLEKNKLYTTNAAAQEKDANAAVGSGTSASAEIVALPAGKGVINAAARTFTSDGDGNAIFRIKLADDETFVLNALPASSTYQIQELSSDHIASFTSESTQNATWVMALKNKANTHSDLVLDTNTETVDAVSNVTGRKNAATNDGTVTIKFKNHKDMITQTGLPYYGDFVYALAALMLAAIAYVVIRKRNSLHLWNTNDDSEI